MIKCTIMGSLLLAWLALIASSAVAQKSQLEAIAFELPVKCMVGELCLVQKLFDHDPSPMRKDYRCGVLTTDGHDGIDFRVRTMADMARGVAVIAAADGIVLRARDGEPDVSVKHRAVLNGRDAGNGVVIDHGNGWETQYSHLRRQSVSVRVGERVRSGDSIGLIGMSGNAEFPHLHFALRYQGQPVDPFTGPLKLSDCKKQYHAGSLWTRSAARVLGYQPTVVIAAGLVPSIPPASVADRPGGNVTPGRSDSLILWADVIGAMPGDLQLFQIVGPDGKSILEQKTKLERGGLTWFAYSGRKAPTIGWSPGQYSGRYQLARNGAIVADRDLRVTIR